MLGGKHLRVVGWTLSFGLVLHAASSGCAEGAVEYSTGGSGGTSTVATTGGAAGAGGSPSGCDMACSAISAPQCLQSVCNEGQYQGVVGQCVVVPADAGTACDDETFCTVDDACDGTGMCIGGPENDCGMTPGACAEVDCVEASQSCTEIP